MEEALIFRHASFTIWSDLKAPYILDLAGLLLSFTSAQAQERLNTSQVRGWGEV